MLLVPALLLVAGACRQTVDFDETTAQAVSACPNAPPEIARAFGCLREARPNTACESCDRGNVARPALAPDSRALDQDLARIQ